MSENLSYHLYIDTNVLINYFTGQTDDVNCLNFLFKRTEKLYTSTLALVQMVTQLQNKTSKRKPFKKEKIFECLDFIRQKITILEVSEDDVFYFKKKTFVGNDIEDFIHYSISKKISCGKIITNDTGHFLNFVGIEALEPYKYLALKKKK
jgi:predicted nucleic acid-binding protein